MFPSPSVGTLSGVEKFFWTTKLDCTEVVISSNGILAGTFSLVATNVTTTSVTLKNVLPAIYYMCYEDTGKVDATYTHYANVTLNVSGITPDAFTWTKITGEPHQFALKESGLGQFSGFEKMFWTEDNNCTTLANTSSPVLFGNVSAGDSSATTTTITLNRVQPKVYKMCYNNAFVDGGYEMYSNVLLTITGRDVV